MAQHFPSLRFLQSAARASDLPPCRSEVAFVGRSNVGKSSLLNAVTGHKQIARVSRTPGRTQLINVFDAGGDRWIVDLPGYGFASAPAHVRNTWKAMLEGYLTTRASLHMVFVLVDAEIGPTPLDQQMTEWLAACGVPFHVVANKVDKLGKSRHTSQHQAVAKQLGRALEDVSWVSAEKGTGVAELRKLVQSVLELG